MSTMSHFGSCRPRAAFLVSVLAVLACTGDALKIYDLIDSERIKDSISDGKYLSLEDCTSDQCHEAGLSRITRAVCVLQCFLKTSSTGRDQFGSGTSRDLTAVGTDLRGRELDPVQACIEAKCLDSQHYMQCAYDRCLTSKRRTRQSSDAWKAVFQRTDPDQIQDWLRVRSKRPIELCSGCFPNSSSWPQCRSSCGK